jgi:cytochrome c
MVVVRQRCAGISSGRRRLRSIVAVACALVLTASCERGGASAPAVPGANPERGRRLVAVYGCGACHVIPGVHDAQGMLGPPLTSWSRRAFIAGVLPNSPTYLMRWVMTPQAVVPGNAMPNMGVTTRDAADITAYLFTIR